MLVCCSAHVRNGLKSSLPWVLGLSGEGMRPVFPGVWRRQSREAVAWVNSVAAIEGGCGGAGFLRSWPHAPEGDRRGCGVGAVPVWVVAGGPCGPDSPGASPLPKRPACPRPRSATFAHDDRPVLFVRASSPVALAVVRATMAPPSGMGGSVGVCRDPLGCVREDQERTW